MIIETAPASRARAPPRKISHGRCTFPLGAALRLQASRPRPDRNREPLASSCGPVHHHPVRLSLVAVAVLVVAASACTTDGAQDGEVSALPPDSAPASPSDGMTPASPSAVVVTADMAAACRHVRAAVDAQQRVTSAGDSDLRTVESEMYAAWTAGHTGSNPQFVQNLLRPGSLVRGDTHTLVDATYRLALLCDVPVPAAPAASD